METRIALNTKNSELSYSALVQHCLNDVAMCTSYPDSELRKDRREIARRSGSEGLSFLTKTLPSFGKAIDLALARGTQLQVAGFKLKRETLLPEFLWALTSRVFTERGWERSDASPDAVKWLRQVCYLLYKLELPFTEKQEADVVSAFIKTEEELPKDWGHLSATEYMILMNARALVGHVLAHVDPMEDLRPRHGPGAVADGRQQPEKCDITVGTYYGYLAEVFPYEEYFFYNASALVDQLPEFLALEEKWTGTAKVVLVPKDSRGPRLISCEPTEYQYIQQGLARTLMRAIETSPLTQGVVNFRDQTINGDLAIAGSKGDPWVTLDMKDASDRVSCLLVEALFPATWWRAMSRARTADTKLPNGTLCRLDKFAPMGSALCFPVESLVFWALSVATIHTVALMGSRTLGLRLNYIGPDECLEEKGNLYVYGDDIIVRREVHASLLQHLPSYGLKFNESKCCTAGLFRESCGVDAYMGVNVTPLRLKRVWYPRIGIHLASYVAFHNACIRKGMFTVADYIRSVMIDHQFFFPYIGDEEQDAVGYVDTRLEARQKRAYNKRHFKRRYNRSLQRYEYRTLRVRLRSIETETKGWTEMMRVALTSSTGETVECPAPASIVRFKTHKWVENFEKFRDPQLVVRAYRYALPHRANLKCGWVELILNE